jgi:hypothetical protein
MPRGKKVKGEPRLDLADPRPMSPRERELYSLLVDDLADAVGGRIKADKRAEKARTESAALAGRELRVRTQLRMFAPELAGMSSPLADLQQAA